VIADVLAAARARIERYTPAEVESSSAVVVDLRCDDVRARDGIIPGSVHVPRSVLEWRCDPSSGYANPALVRKPLILVCEHGYSSSLAAASLRHLGADVGDLAGGFEAWVASGRPVAPAPPPADGLPGMGGPQ
jgi:rhodanese-related sulfurtransferase